MPVQDGADPTNLGREYQGQECRRVKDFGSPSPKCIRKMSDRKDYVNHIHLHSQTIPIEAVGLLAGGMSIVRTSAILPSPNRICKMADNPFYILLHAQPIPIVSEIW
jgi:hypothetical protein